MANSVVRYQDAAIDDRKSYAQTIASAGDMLPKGLLGIVKDPNGNNVQAIVPGKVLLVLETGRMLGVDPMAAIQGINVIEGKASISPALMMAVVRGKGHDIKVVLTGTVAGGDIKATATLIRADDGSEWTETWDIDRAMRAGLVDSYEPDGNGVFHVVALGGKDHDIPKPWQTYTENLLRHRAVGDVCKFGATDVLMGIHYIPEELGSIVSEEGTIEPESVLEFAQLEDDFIEKIKGIQSRDELEVLWNDIQDRELWTKRVEAAFTAHLANLPASAKRGGPGNTGLADFDEQPVPGVKKITPEVFAAHEVHIDRSTEPPQTEAEPPESHEHTPETPVSEAGGDENPADGRTASKGEDVHDAEIVPDAPAEETDEEREARIEHENYLAAVAEGAVESPKDGGLFDASALTKGTSQR